MKINKEEILKYHCYTELVYQRINKKLSVNFSKEESELHIKNVLKETDLKDYRKEGKNFYITNRNHSIRITINSNTFRVITVDKFVQ